MKKHEDIKEDKKLIKEELKKFAKKDLKQDKKMIKKRK